MSLEAEVAFAALAAARPGPVALLSLAGLGAPLVPLAAPTARIALRPAGGFFRAPARRFAPPLDAATPEARALARRARLFVDAREGGPALREAAAALGAEPEAWLGEAPPPGLRAAGFGLRLAPWVEPPPAGDAFAALAGFARAEGWLRAIRPVPGGAEAEIDPLAALDAPEADQLDRALGEGRATAASDGALRLALPRFAGAALFRFEMASGPVAVEAAAPPGAVAAEGPRATLRLAGAGEGARLRLRAGPAAELVSVRLVLPLPPPDAALWAEAAARAAREEE